MPAAEKAPTVFFARDKQHPWDGFVDLRESIEKDDSMVNVVSDIMGYESDDDEPESPTPAKAKKHTFAAKRRLPPHSENDDDDSSKTMDTPSKRQRRSLKNAATTPRRSERISSAASPPKEETSKAKAPAKRGRGRPPTKGLTARRGPQQEWEVESIVDSQIDAVTSEHFYLVKWKGFASKQNTWEPKKNLSSCLQLVQAFEKKKPTKRR
ncbi:hypothetical protein FZEAL_2921 [Fusarium zealandicum]|uniref:Chromo domain-containing protein n=1 Tax=Fusarium zealandicum TaxID=1053134 RepID=A0A8H4UPT5_9HYPO|nr:hypothetical protein FZEAL_2921 [Fusarium zealandicum]